MTLRDFENKWISKIESDYLKSFPESFLNDEETEIFNLPKTSLIKGPELFGSYELLDSNGNSILQSDNLDKIKYILYANRTKPDRIIIPVLDSEITKAVKEYEKHLDSLVKIIESEFKANFSTSKSFLVVSNKVFNSLNLHRY